VIKLAKWALEDNTQMPPQLGQPYGKIAAVWLQLVPQTKGDWNHLSSGHQSHTTSLKQLHQHFKGLSKAALYNLTRSYFGST